MTSTWQPDQLMAASTSGKFLRQSFTAFSKITGTIIIAEFVILNNLFTDDDSSNKNLWCYLKGRR